MPNYHDVLAAELDLVESVIRFIVRRHRLNSTEAEEFGGLVRLKLVENDYDVLRRFQGRSSLRTYLTTVIERLYLDFRIRAWGKWRPSVEARRAGPVGIRLEALLVRDGLSFEQAFETLTTNHGVEASRDELYQISVKLPSRAGRRFVGEEAIVDKKADGPDPEANVLRGEQGSIASRVRQVLARVLEGQTGQDRLVLKMRFEDDFSVADIARALRLDQKALYRRLARLLGQLREGLEEAGVRAGEVSELLGSTGADVEWDAGAVGKPEARPSIGLRG